MREPSGVFLVTACFILPACDLASAEDWHLRPLPAPTPDSLEQHIFALAGQVGRIHGFVTWGVAYPETEGKRKCSFAAGMSLCFTTVGETPNVRFFRFWAFRHFTSTVETLVTELTDSLRATFGDGAVARCSEERVQPDRDSSGPVFGGSVAVARERGDSARCCNLPRQRIYLTWQRIYRRFNATNGSTLTARRTGAAAATAATAHSVIATHTIVGPSVGVT